MSKKHFTISMLFYVACCIAVFIIIPIIFNAEIAVSISDVFTTNANLQFAVANNCLFFFEAVEAFRNSFPLSIAAHLTTIGIILAFIFAWNSHNHPDSNKIMKRCNA